MRMLDLLLKKRSGLEMTRAELEFISAGAADGWRVSLAVETTLDEVVDVRVTSGAGALATCLAETVWQLQLDRHTFDASHDDFAIELGQ